jgi:O-antigen/teichoic acid export membrane protein
MKKSMKSKIKTNKVLQAGMGYTIGNYLLKGINLITLPIFARLMNKTDYGLFNIYMSYEGIFVILIGVTLHSSLKSARYEFKNDYRKYVSSIEIVPMIMLAVALLIMNLFSGSVTQVTGLNLLTLDLLMIHSYCSALLQFYNADLSIDYKYTSFLKIAFFNTIANVLISLILMTTVLSSKRYAARIAGCVVPLVLICVYILFKLFSSEKPKYNKTFWKFGVKYSLPIVPHGLSQIVLSQFDRIMINNMVGVAEAGIYSFAFNINTIIQILVNSLDTVYGPWYYEKADKKEFKQIKEVSTIYMYAMWCVIVAIMLVAPEVVLILGGKEYYESRIVVLPLLACTFFTFLYLLPSTTEYYLKKTWNIAFATSCIAVLNIILNYFFIKQFGYIAGAYTTLFCYICYFLFHYLMAKKLIGFQQFDTKIIAILAVLLFAVLAVCYVLLDLLVFRWTLMIIFVLVNALLLLNMYKTGKLKGLVGEKNNE